MGLRRAISWLLPIFLKVYEIKLIVYIKRNYIYISTKKHPAYVYEGEYETRGSFNLLTQSQPRSFPVFVCLLDFYYLLHQLDVSNILG